MSKTFGKMIEAKPRHCVLFQVHDNRIHTCRIHFQKLLVLEYQIADPYLQRLNAEKNAADKTYRFKIFNNFQRLIGHLASSEQTFFTPREFWDHLKLCGELINVRDQQDAMEYYSQIVDTLHEAMKGSCLNNVRVQTVRF